MPPAEALRRTFAEIHARLDELGVDEIVPTLATADQLQSAFRGDLLLLGRDPADLAQVESALAGLAVGLKVLISNNLPVGVVRLYVSLCESLLPVLEQEPVDVSALEPSADPDQAYVGSTPEAPSPPVCGSCGQPSAEGTWVCLACQRVIARQLLPQPPSGPRPVVTDVSALAELLGRGQPDLHLHLGGDAAQAAEALERAKAMLEQLPGPAVSPPAGRAPGPGGRMQMGGPGFYRGPEQPPAPPRRRWWQRGRHSR